RGLALDHPLDVADDRVGHRRELRRGHRAAQLVGRARDGHWPPPEPHRGRVGQDHRRRPFVTDRLSPVGTTAELTIWGRPAYYRGYPAAHRAFHRVPLRPWPGLSSFLGGLADRYRQPGAPSCARVFFIPRTPRLLQTGDEMTQPPADIPPFRY